MMSSVSLSDKFGPVLYSSPGEPPSTSNTMTNIVGCQLGLDIYGELLSNVQILSTNPKSFRLHQNHPNPFNPTTKIQYDLSESSEVRLTVYDMLGKEVAQIVHEQQSAGSYQATWNACDRLGQQVPSGIYFYRLQAGKFQQVRKMLLVR